MRLVLSIVLLAACSSVDPEPFYADGTSDVGYRRVEVSYDAPGADEPRVIGVDVWYPASLDGEQVVTYRVGGIVSLTSENAFEDAAPAIEGDAPLIVYSHGSGGQGLLGYPYGEHLASHGWVVVAPDHVGNTAQDFVGGSSNPITLNAINRPLDISAVLDAAEGGFDGAFTVDASNALVFGHSFGGYTALAVAGMRLDVEPLIAGCEGAEEDDANCAVVNDPEMQAIVRDGFVDDRIVATVPQAPAFIGGAVASSIPGIDIPVFVQSGERDQTTTHETQPVPLWAGLDGEQDLWMNLPDGGHYSFVSICEDLDGGLIDLFVDGADEDGCGDDFVPASEAVASLRASLQAFAELHVKGETGWEKAMIDTDWGAGSEMQAASP